MFVELYIDDNMCCGNQTAIDSFKEDVREHFKTKEKGIMNEYVGCQVRRKLDCIWMHQSELIIKIEKRFKKDFENTREYISRTGYLDNVKMPNEDYPTLDTAKKNRQRSGIGMLLYLIKFSRPDLSNSVRELSKAVLSYHKIGRASW